MLDTLLQSFISYHSLVIPSIYCYICSSMRSGSLMVFPSDSSRNRLRRAQHTQRILNKTIRH